MRKLLDDSSGSTVIEFALLAPIFLLFVIGSVEGCRMLWMQQTLEEVAYTSARCMSVGVDCVDAAGGRTYAVSRASGYGIGITTGDVTVQTNVTCRGFPTSSRVVVTHGFGSVLDGLVSAFPDTLTAESCFPVLVPPS